MKKLLTLIIAFCLCSSLMSSIVLAQTGSGTTTTGGTTTTASGTTGGNPNAPTTSSFDVGKYLTVPGQNQKYLGKDKDCGNSGTYNSETQTFTTDCAKKLANPVAAIIVQIINFLTLTIGSVALLALIIGGFLMMTSHGSENQLTKAKDVIKFAIIGLVITFSAYYIVAFVQGFFFEL